MTKAASVWSSLVASNRKAIDSLSSNYGYLQLEAGNYEEAFAFFTKEALKSDDSALYALGVMYFLGHGVKKDLSKAYEYLCNVKQLPPYGAVILGCCALLGIGCLKDYSLAKRLISENLFLCGGNDIFDYASIVFGEESPLFDKVTEYALLNLSVLLGIADAVYKRDSLEKSLTLDEVCAAQEQSRQMLENRQKHQAS